MNFTPKHLRRGGAARNGSVGIEKTQAFRRAAQWSKRFIHQSASRLAKADLAADYEVYCERSRNGSLRA